ncbi:hypothetical protein H6P81_016416 [Aristolochia fimbriata]|uniref:Uncharacterized protein n=1 Tax=Aristolochia fimbriata TaxID=158543 RepID=A0AAV7EB58_ARIFI|nr:hypothetical protein H6P81_016416 [Aristolochia fimbriata]
MGKDTESSNHFLAPTPLSEILPPLGKYITMTEPTRTRKSNWVMARVKGEIDLLKPDIEGLMVKSEGAATIRNAEDRGQRLKKTTPNQTLMRKKSYRSKSHSMSTRGSTSSQGQSLSTGMTTMRELIYKEIGQGAKMLKKCMHRKPD